MIITVFGLGFVGLTTALGFADKGFTVRGFDVDDARCGEIRNGRLPFFEPGLDEALLRNLGKSFIVADSAAEAVVNADACFICVGTPNQNDGHADLKYVFAVIDSMEKAVPADCVIIIKSTVLPGTTVECIKPYIRSKSLTNPVAVNPEFLREGHSWIDFTKPSKIVCGVSDEKAKSVLAKLYKDFNAPIHFLSPNTTEFIKYLSNSFLATLISYSNEMALMAEAIGGINIADAFHILHEDHRLAGAGINEYIYPGCGYGGYCLPKDTAVLSTTAKAHGFTPRILDDVISLNDKMAALTAQKIIRKSKNKDANIGILGLSFKPGSDDVRDSPAANIIAELIKEGYQNIYAYDPVANAEFERVHGLPITYCSSATEVCEACDAIAVVTIWDEFKTIKSVYPNKQWIDCRYFMEG
jgi:UDPglucose 6-dehydrogenase